MITYDDILRDVILYYVLVLVTIYCCAASCINMQICDEDNIERATHCKQHTTTDNT